ncbi:MAG: FliM/FliN family flagellar motor switch protein [Acidobacteriales bacterium]|nr:FliM/FliN family flagellar motor switch protein [Terriglobales bacterium]
MTPAEATSHFADIPIDVEVELDRKPMTLGEILELSPGCVIKLTRSAGENLDLLVGETLVGFGEIVIIEDIMGVRITDFWGDA